MIKKYMCMALTAVLILVSTGCGTKEEQVEPTADGLAEKLIEELTFDDDIEEVSGDTALKYYDIEASMIAECAIYMSSGATAEEVAVFETSSESDAATVLERMTERRDEQVKSYVEYNSSEIQRLESALLCVQGTFVIYVVADDGDKAEDIIKGYLE